MICRCKKEVETERAELGLTVCLSCAKKGIAQPAPYKGVMVYSHKTAGEVNIMSPECFRDFKRLNPTHRNAGRGSGVHVVTKTTSRI